MFARVLTFLLALVVFWSGLFAPEFTAPKGPPGDLGAVVIAVAADSLAEAAEVPMDELPLNEQHVLANAEAPVDDSFGLHASSAVAALAAAGQAPAGLVMAALRPPYLETLQRPPCAAPVAA